MKHLFRRAGGAALLGVLSFGWGCSDDQTGLYIQGNVRIEPPQCIARAEANTTLLLTGFLDVSLKLDYDAILLVGNQMTPRGDKENLRTETMAATITGAEVQLFNDVGEPVREFTVPASGVINPDTSEDPGFGVISVTLLPADEGFQLSGELESRGEVQTRVAQVRVFGETLGGLEVESADITYVVRVCKGCLVSFPAETLDNNQRCNNSLTEATDDLPCRIGQDDFVDCRVCRGFNEYCLNALEVQ